MKRLIMIRHAKSSWDNLYLADHDRPLNGRGKRNAPEMGRRLKSRAEQIDLFLSSTAKRALSTAKRIAKEMGYPKSNIQTTRALFHAGSIEILSVIQLQSSDMSTIAIFGHNPGFTSCINRLSRVDIDNVPTCGVAIMDFDLENWSDVQFGLGNLVHYDFPKNQIPQ